MTSTGDALELSAEFERAKRIPWEDTLRAAAERVRRDEAEATAGAAWATLLSQIAPVVDG